MRVAVVALWIATSVGGAFAQGSDAPAPAPTPGPAPAPAPAPAPTSAPAAYPPPVYVPPPRERHGLFATSGLWAGNISCDGTDCGGFREAGGLNLAIGYMFTPRFGLLVDGWAMTSSQNNVSITFVTSTLNARLWLSRALWIQGGIGSGHAILRWGPFTTGASDDVPVGMFAAGFELVRGPRWAIDVAFKVAQGSQTDVETNEVRTGRSTGLGASFIGFLN